MMTFSTGTGLELVGVFGPDLDYWRPGLQAQDVALLCKIKKEGGSVRASPVAAPMPKSVSYERKERLLRLLSMGVCVAYLSPMG